MAFPDLWAKSPRKRDPAVPPTVAEHCRQVRDAAAALWNVVGNDLAALLDVDASALREEIEPLLACCALAHDMGKVNSSFQAMLRSRPGDTMRQPVRHEILGAWLLFDPDTTGRWFGNLKSPAETWPIIWAIAGHHLKMCNPATLSADPRQPASELFNLGSTTASVDIPLTNCQVRELLSEVAAALGQPDSLPVLSDLSFDTADDDDESLQERISRFADASARMWAKLGRDPVVKRRTALLKAMLIAADVAASALIADGRKPISWAADALRVRITSDDLNRIVIADLAGKKLRGFQCAVGNSSTSATIVIAGCGNGKTTAAYLWGTRHAAGRKLWFAYPTTGTASAGYEDYLFTQKELASDLFHSRSKVDLESLQGNGDDRDEEQFRLESLRAWDRQAIVCTVDTVLGLLQNQRRPLFSFPAIAAGAFVFDEIHSYDARLFGGLLRFLEVFPGASVLLMSASIPPARMNALRRVLGDRVGDVICGDATLERHQRYRLEPRASAEACREEVRAALQRDQKVLWVCNTVGDAVKTATEARDWAGVEPTRILVYHSRFRYCDRVGRQKEVIAEFAYQTDKGKRHLRASPGPALVITTQVCEMSLDISADLMVTAECPLPALVQRLGRLNRYATADDPWPCLIYPFSGDPYNERPEFSDLRGDWQVEMTATRKAVEQLAGTPCCQRDLSERLDRIVREEHYECYSAWMDDGWITEQAQVRDGDNSITVIREEDLSEIEEKLGKEHSKPTRWTSSSLVPWTIPMRYRRSFQPGRRVGGYPIAPAGSISYKTEDGAEWQNNTT